MVSGFICGTSSFPREEDEYERHTRSADSSPRKSRSSKSNNKNPYSSRGLDKFTALLAEIEEKRQQVYSQVDPHEISLVRFVYAGDDDFKPIVVKIKSKNSLDHDRNRTDPNAVKPFKFRKLNSSSSMKVKEEHKKGENISSGKIKKMDFCKNLRIYEWKESQFYLVVIVVFILMFLVLFGRSFAIMCTSIGWYVMPIITKHANYSWSNIKVSTKKKDYAIRRLSNKRIITSEGTKSFKSSNGK